MAKRGQDDENARVRLLGRVADVRRGEGVVVLLLAANAFLLLTSYYVFKTAREPLILLGGAGGVGGAELKTYAAAVQALLLLLLLPGYGRLASRVPRMKLVNVSGGIVLGCLALFYGLGRVGFPIGVPYYLWLGMTSLLIVAQFWSFANDYYSRAQGERLFPLIAAGGSLGAIVGAATARWLLDGLGVMGLLLLGAAILVAYLGIFNAVERLPRPDRARDEAMRAPLDGPGAFALIRRTRYLLLIGVMVLIATLVNTQGEYILARVVSAHAEAAAPGPAGPVSAQEAEALEEARRLVIGRFYGGFYSAVNAVAFLLQLFVVSRLLPWLGVARALLVFPLVAMGTNALIAALPLFPLVGVAKLTENSADYSLQNTLRQALFLPTSREAKYKAKAAIDSFFFRAGDLLAAASVFVGAHLLGLSVRGFAVENVVLVCLWLLVVLALGRHYRRLAAGDGHR